jgi:hypothetical protein
MKRHYSCTAKQRSWGRRCVTCFVTFACSTLIAFGLVGCWHHVDVAVRCVYFFMSVALCLLSVLADV